MKKTETIDTKYIDEMSNEELKEKIITIRRALDLKVMEKRRLEEKRVNDLAFLTISFIVLLLATLTYKFR